MSYTDYDFPHTHMYDSDLRELIANMRKLEETVKTFVATNSVELADPIQWNIANQYAKNNIVLDNVGNAYLSKQPVPAGIELDNEEYWLEIFNYTQYVKSFNSNLTYNIEENTTRASKDYAVGDWLVLDDLLYKVIAAIEEDELFVVDTNIQRFTVEEFCRAWVDYANALIQQYKDDIDASELAYRQQLAQDIADTTASLQAQLNQAISGATVDSEVVLARVGTGDVTYTTLGDAIRFQIAALLDNITNLSETSLNLARGLEGRYRINSTGVIQDSTANSYWGLDRLIPCAADTEYLFAVWNTGVSTSTRFYVAWYDSTKTFISRADNNRAANNPIRWPQTSPATAAYMCFSVYNSNGISENSKCDIRLGATVPTTYVSPYMPVDEVARGIANAVSSAFDSAILNQSLANGTDLNTLYHYAVYRLGANSTYPNEPISGGRRLLIVSTYSRTPSNASNCYQILIECKTGRIYTRMYHDGAFDPWASSDEMSRRLIAGANPHRKALDHGGFMNTKYGYDTVYQNSPEAFLAAARAGIKFHNLDIVFSSDYVPYVYHDINVTDINNVSYNLNNETAATINTLTFGDANYSFNLMTLRDARHLIENSGGSIDMVDVSGHDTAFDLECASRLATYYKRNNMRIEWTNFDYDDLREAFQSGNDYGLYFVCNSEAKINSALSYISSHSGRKYCMNVGYSNATVAAAFDAVSETVFAAGITVYIYTYNALNYSNAPGFADGIISENVNVNYEFEVDNDIY